MIIDLILDRKNGEAYNPRDLYDYALTDGFHEIATAIDDGTNEDIQIALCNYIIENGYNESICDYINSVNWLANDYGSILITAQNDNASIILHSVKISEPNFNLYDYLRDNLDFFDWELDDGEEGSGYVQYACKLEDEGDYLLANYYQEDYDY